MDCKEFRESLDLYVDGELSADAMAAASVHLNECPACHRAKEELLRLRLALKSVVAQHQPPPNLVYHIHHFFLPFWPRQLLRLREKLRAGGLNLITPSQELAEKAHAEKAPLWRRKIALPIPVFATLLLALVALGFWSAYLRLARPPAAETGRINTTQPESEPPQAPEAGIDFSRFDRGERAAIYKVRRAQEGSVKQ